MPRASPQGRDGGMMRAMASAAERMLTDVACTERGDGWALRAAFCVPADHAILAGHFPGAPVVPGVLLVDAVRGACERTFALHLGIAAVDDLRFFRPVAPGESVALAANVVRSPAGFAVDGEWSAADGRVAAFRLRLARDA